LRADRRYTWRGFGGWSRGTRQSPTTNPWENNRSSIPEGTRLATGQVARVVFHAVAVADLSQHFQVVAGALLQTLGFQQLAFFF
jgi:hypothetical protein